MNNEKGAAEIAQAIEAAFPHPQGEIPPERIETVMRPFAPISYETEEQLKMLLHRRGKGSLALKIGPWMEANFVVSGTGAMVERRILFLLMDTCTCVLGHLPAAITHAQGEVDPRIRALLPKK